MLELTLEGNATKLVVARKGLNKFFDCSYEFVSREKRYDSENMSVFKLKVKNYILAGPARTLIQGGKIEVFKTLKANGENAQVSYNPDVKAWVIASKNVALVANNADQVDAYPSEKF